MCCWCAYLKTVLQLVLLDEHGKEVTSEQFADLMADASDTVCRWAFCNAAIGTSLLSSTTTTTSIFISLSFCIDSVKGIWANVHVSHCFPVSCVSFSFSSVKLKVLSGCWHWQGASALVFCIGGPFGHGPQLHARANITVKLSSMVLNHQLAFLVLLEQIYRFCCCFYIMCLHFDL